MAPTELVVATEVNNCTKASESCECDETERTSLESLEEVGSPVDITKTSRELVVESNSTPLKV